MFTKKSIFLIFTILLLVAMMSGNASAQPLNATVGTGFAYQGKLMDGGSPANGAYDLQFALYNALSGGTQVGSTITDTNVAVTAGLFTVQLDFGNVFDGTALYLEIGVRLGGSSGAFTTLAPRQPLSATPYSQYSIQATNANLLNNQNAAYYQNASNINSGTLGVNYYDSYANLSAAGYLGNAVNNLALNNGVLQNTLNADLLDGLHASSFALAGHNHWGETWTGSGTGLTLNGGDTGLSGSGTTYGVYGAGTTGVQGVSTAALGSGVLGTNNTDNGYGLTGIGNTGVDGSGDTVGVDGTGNTYGVRGSGGTYGVYGTGTNASSGIGVYGNGDNDGIYGNSGNHGVWGQGGAYGVVGIGGIGMEGDTTTIGGIGIQGIAYNGTGDYAGLFRGNVQVNGNLTVSGTKSAVVNTKDYGNRTLYAVESPQNWFEDFGTGQLTNGAAVITIDPVFAETVNLTEDYHVFLTPNGDCELYVGEKSPTSFSVQAMSGQTCSIAFDYRIVAQRLGYETVRLAQVNTPLNSELPTK
jgi:hypothetical protein